MSLNLVMIAISNLSNIPSTTDIRHSRSLSRPTSKKEEWTVIYSSNTISMNNTHRGLPLTRAHVEQVFPKLISAQIRRIAARGECTCDGTWRSAL
jgi:hypothetical protein